MTPAASAVSVMPDWGLQETESICFNPVASVSPVVTTVTLKEYKRREPATFLTLESTVTAARVSPYGRCIKLISQNETPADCAVRTVPNIQNALPAEMGKQRVAVALATTASPIAPDASESTLTPIPATFIQKKLPAVMTPGQMPQAQLRPPLDTASVSLFETTKLARSFQ
jgi:hypothetical protein